MISKNNLDLVALQLITTEDFDQNLNNLCNKIELTKENSFVLAPELTLSGYSYQRLEEASLFTQKAIKKLLPLSQNKVISLTMITKQDNNYFNTLFVMANQKIVHTQSKNRLFVLNDEKKYFTSGNEEDIKLFEIDGIQVGAIICFELRFLEFWQKLKGADIILLPAMWGKIRKENLEALSKALAIMNQCFVIVSDGANEDLAKGSGIITPFGDEYRDDLKEVIIKEADFKEIKKMRKYMNIGLK